MTRTLLSPPAPVSDTRVFAVAAEAADAERDRLFAALAARPGRARTEDFTNLLMHSFAQLNARCEKLRAVYFPDTALLSIAHGTATTWSTSGLMRTVWRKATG